MQARRAETNKLSTSLANHHSAYHVVSTNHRYMQVANASTATALSMLLIMFADYFSQVSSLQSHDDLLKSQPRAIDTTNFNHVAIGASLVFCTSLVLQQLYIQYVHPASKPQSADAANQGTTGRLRDARLYKQTGNLSVTTALLLFGATAWNLQSFIGNKMDVADQARAQLEALAVPRLYDDQTKNRYDFAGTPRECRRFRRTVRFMHAIDDVGASAIYAPDSTGQFAQRDYRRLFTYKCNQAKPNSAERTQFVTDEQLRFLLSNTVIEMSGIRLVSGLALTGMLGATSAIAHRIYHSRDEKSLEEKYRTVNQLLKRFHFVGTTRSGIYAIYPIPSHVVGYRKSKITLTPQQLVDVLHKHLPMFSTPMTIAIDLSRINLNALMQACVAIEKQVADMRTRAPRQPVAPTSSTTHHAIYQPTASESSLVKRKPVPKRIKSAPAKPMLRATSKTSQLPNLVMQHDGRIYAFPTNPDAYPIFHVARAGIPHTEVFAFFSPAIGSELGPAMLHAHQAALASRPQDKGTALKYTGNDDALKQQGIVFKTKPNAENGIRRVGFRLFDRRPGALIYVGDAIVTKRGKTEKVYVPSSKR